jgi:hypothetical protein
MRRRLLTAVAGVLLAASVSPSAQAGICEVFRSPIRFATDAEVQMMVLSGRDCRIRFREKEVFPVERNQLTGWPLHGGARVEGMATAYYRSNPGYRGADRFSFTLCGAEGAMTACSRVTVRVHVR